MNEKISLKYRISVLKNKIIRFFKTKSKTIEIQIPKNFMNCGVSIKNNFVADTNNSQNWDTLCFPLPKPKHKWNIKSYKGEMNSDKKYVVLVDCA